LEVYPCSAITSGASASNRYDAGTCTVTGRSPTSRTAVPGLGTEPVPGRWSPLQPTVTSTSTGTTADATKRRTRANHRTVNTNTSITGTRSMAAVRPLRQGRVSNALGTTARRRLCRQPDQPAGRTPSAVIAAYASRTAAISRGSSVGEDRRSLPPAAGHRGCVGIGESVIRSDAVKSPWSPVVDCRMRRQSGARPRNKKGRRKSRPTK
jgi:hypothetical protein